MAYAVITLDWVYMDSLKLDNNCIAAASRWDLYFGKEQASSSWVWWKEQAIINYLGKLICGEFCTRVEDLSIFGIKKHCAADVPFEHGLSVGCGVGYKEIALLQSGIVKYFTLYDISQEALHQAHIRAEKAGVEDAVRLVCADAFQDERGKFDLVYWDNALHHMMDVYVALAWSRGRLKRGGTLILNDFVGPTRFQWDEKWLTASNNALKLFNAPPICKPDPKTVEKDDPSEAADSGRIKEAFLRYFPDVLWIPMGGALYFAGFTGKSVTFTPNSIVKMIGLDARLNAAGIYAYAFAVAKKA